MPVRGVDVRRQAGRGAVGLRAAGDDLPRQARRGAGGVDDELAAPRRASSPRTAVVRALRASDGALAAVARRRCASVPSGQRRGEGLADALPARRPASWWTTRSPPTTRQAVEGAVEADVGAAVGVDDGVARRRRPGRRWRGRRPGGAGARRGRRLATSAGGRRRRCRALRRSRPRSAAARPRWRRRRRARRVLRFCAWMVAFREVRRAPEWARHPPTSERDAGYAAPEAAGRSAEVEEVLQPDGQAGLVADRAQPGQHAGRERRPGPASRGGS